MIDDVATLLAQRAGLDLRHLAGPAFHQVLQQRVARLGLGAEDYVRRLGSDPTELEYLAGHVAVPETWLFRYPLAFDFLVEALRTRRETGPLLMLSAGCAAGQEAYSMAAAALHAGCDPRTTRILAIDRRQDLIEVARAGRLPETPRRHPIPCWASRWFDRTDEGCRVDPALSAIVEFRVGDLLATAPEPGAYFVVFCRNVLIYLSDEARRALLSRLVDALAPAGLLFLGHADRATDAPQALERAGGVQSFAFRRATAAAPAAVPALPTQPPAPKPAPPSGQLRERSTSVEASTGSPIGASTQQAQASTASSKPAATPIPARIASPDSGTPDLSAAQRLADEGRLQEAAAAVRNIVARFGTSAGTAEVLGVVALAEQDLPTARRHLEEAVYLEPRRASALLNLALVLERLGDGTRAATIRARARRAASVT